MEILITVCIFSCVSDFAQKIEKKSIKHEHWGKKFYRKSPKISSVLSRLCGFASHFPLRRVCCVNWLWPDSEMTNNPDPLRHTENQNVVETGQPKACTTFSDELGGKEFWEWCTGRE